MNSKRAVIFVIVLLVLGTVCIVLAGPALMKAIGSIHVIPPH